MWEKNRNIPVILPLKYVQYIELILKHREQASVLNENPYVFGLFSTNGIYKFRRDCAVLR